MARRDTQELYQQLLITRLKFVSRGKRHIHYVYHRVEAQFPKLCDDNYLCRNNCSSGHNQPEWQHAVRRALDHLKSESGPVSKSDQRGFWIFK